MEKNRLESLLILIVPQVIQWIVEKSTMDEIKAAEAFYQSRVYSLLEEEETKMWHLSPLTLYHMFEEEHKTGEITFPEE